MHATIRPNARSRKADVFHMPADNSSPLVTPNWLLAFVALLLTSACPSLAQVAIVDDFDGAALHPRWTVRFLPSPSGTVNVSGWTGGQADGKFEVQAIQPIAPDQDCGLGVSVWSIIALETDLPMVQDFDTSATLSWNETLSNDVQFVWLEVLGQDGNTVALCGFHDAWSSSGQRTACVGAIFSCIGSGVGSLPLSGSAVVRLQRSGSDVTARWNGLTIHAGHVSAPAIRLRVVFGYYPNASRCSVPSTFGTEAVDNLSFVGTCLSGCAADMNCSGTTSPQDIFDFLAAWFGQLAPADFNHVNGITVQDIFDFLAAWFVGC